VKLKSLEPLDGKRRRRGGRRREEELSLPEEIYISPRPSHPLPTNPWPRSFFFFSFFPVQSRSVYRLEVLRRSTS
jgi:hypothetical protein